MQMQSNMPEQKPVSFIAEKVKRLSAGGDSQEMMATIREYLLNERGQHATAIYEHTAHTAKVIPIARLKAV